MLDVRYSSRFKKDFRLCTKRDYKMDVLEQVIDILRTSDHLPRQFSDHALSGDWAGYRECHLESDWLLIYRRTQDELLLYRTGTHSDLFGK